MGNLSQGSASSYYDWARRGQVFSALARVTAPVIYSTAAGTGGPLLWNNTGATSTGATGRGVVAVLLAMSASVTTASGVATSLGITGGNVTVAPTSTTTIDASGNVFFPQTAPQCNVYRKGTVTTAGSFYFPTIQLDTGAVTLTNATPAWVDLHGMFMVGPGGWLAVAAGATATSAVIDIGLIWAEIPL